MNTIKLGQKTFNFALKVPTSKVAEVEAVLAEHAAFMKEHHSFDDSKIHLHHYYVSKSDDLNDVMDPSKGTTGHVVYSVNEVYMVPQGIGQHLEKAGAWEGMARFFPALMEHGEVLVMSGDVIHTL